jgi:hypothetical protein
MTMLQGTWMYSNPESIPFSATQYTPLYYIISSSVCNLFSLNPGDDVIAIYRISRLISFLASILSGYLIFIILNKVGKISTHWSYWTALLCLLCTIPWYYTVRPDSLMAFFFFASIYCFGMNQIKGRYSSSYLIACGAFACLSFFSKQNGLILSVAIGSYLLFNGRIKDLGLFISGFLVGIVIFAIVFQSYYSEFFFDHLLQGLNNGIDIQTAIVSVYYSFMSRFGTLFILAGLLIFILHAKISCKTFPEEFRFLIYLLMVTFLFSMGTALKVGADINYFNEVICISLMILTVGGSLIKNVYKELDYRMAKLSVFCLIFAFALSLSTSNFLAFGIRNIKRMSERDDVYKKELLDFIREEGRKDIRNFYIVSEEAFVNNAFPLQIVLPHHDIASLWYARNVYDFDKLKKAVSQGKILLYIGNGDKLSSYDINLEDNFTLIQVIEGYKIYRNKNAIPLN